VHKVKIFDLVYENISVKKGLSRGALHLILKEVFGMGPEWEAQAAVLASASAP